MRIHSILRCLRCLLLACLAGNTPVSAEFNGSPFRPNFLWLTSEDNGPHLGCYDDPFANSPHLDALATRGVKYVNAWSNAPVCAPARTTIITGMYPTSLGAQHMRSAVAVPDDVKLYPLLMRELGYYCTNNSKTDYNLAIDHANIWDDSSNRAHWRNRRAGQPFFAVFNFTTTHESQLRTRPHQAVHDPNKVPIPPYHPDTPEVRQDWAQYYDRIAEMDREVGKILEQLKTDNLSDSTIVFYYADHGSGMPRSKRWLYESGLRVPLIVHIPERLRALIPSDYQAGSTSQRLVSFVDLVPTILSLAGASIPDYLQGKAFLGGQATEDPSYVYGFRDRMDERYDISRSVRDQQFSYIRNFMPHRPQGTFLAYMFETPTTQVWKQMFDSGDLNEVQSRFWMMKPPEELYDLEKDPHQIDNLADNPAYTETLQSFRNELMDWMVRTGDLGLLPEGEMLEQARGESPISLVDDPQKFPISEILATADLASRPQPGDIDQLKEHRVSRHGAVRYWVANGLLLRAMLSQQGSGNESHDTETSESVNVARSMIGDSSPYVRSLVCETLCRFGSREDRGLAMKELLRLADPRTEGVLPAISALNSLDWSEPNSQELGSSLEGLPSTLPGVEKRYGTYVGRLIERISGSSSSGDPKAN